MTVIDTAVSSGGGMTADSSASLRRAARVAGCAFLLALVIVVVANYGVSFRLIIPENDLKTAQNILANETLFRLNIACNLAYAVTVLVLVASLHVILRTIDPHLALLAGSFRSVCAVMWCVTSLKTLDALRQLHAAAEFGPGQAYTLAGLDLASSYDAYYVGLPFWALASSAGAWLLLRSRAIPAWLGLTGILTSAWCVFCAFMFMVLPEFETVVHPGWYDTPLVLFEITLGIRFLVKGLRGSHSDGPHERATV